MRRLLLATAVVLTAGCTAATPPAAKVETEEQKTLYALGYAVSDNLKSFDLKPEEAELVKAGFADGIAKKKATAEPQEYMAKLRELNTTRMAASATRTKEEGKAFIDKMAAEKGAEKLASGMVIQTVTEGPGASPKATDTVKVHYHGTLMDGKVFDSSVDRKEPATFPLNGVIPCWTEGVQKMKVGGKAKLYCPSDLAYGDQSPSPDIGPGATLIFDVELLAIESAAQAK
jgi:FKBP-type peptidyl-prolyl cis-trans isomerase FkpA